MSKRKSAAEANLEARAQLFKALGHPVRLLMLNLVKRKPRHGEELAAILQLNPATVSHHLSKLAEAGLLHVQKEQYYQIYSLNDLMLPKSLEALIQLPQPELANTVQEDAYQQQVLDTFFKHGRLRKIPAQRKKQHIILQKIVTELEPDKAYPEMALNHLLIEFHDDVAWLRRALVEHRLMTREDGIYQRTSTS